MASRVASPGLRRRRALRIKCFSSFVFFAFHYYGLLRCVSARRYGSRGDGLYCIGFVVVIVLCIVIVYSTTFLSAIGALCFRIHIYGYARALEIESKL